MFQSVADELNSLGITTKQVITIVAPRMMTKDLVKELIWKPIQIAQVNKKHTADLTTKEVDEVLDPFTVALGEIGLQVTFPSIKIQMQNNQ